MVTAFDFGICDIALYTRLALRLNHYTYSISSYSGSGLRKLRLVLYLYILNSYIHLTIYLNIVA